jgi:hypothetical protein
MRNGSPPFEPGTDLVRVHSEASVAEASYGRMENAMKLRILAAAGVLVSAGVHLKLWFDGFRDLHMIGPAFMLNAVAGLVIALLLILWRHWLPLLLAVGFGASTLGAFLISATVGLYGVHEVWTGGWVLTAAASEVVAILAGGVALVRQLPSQSDGQLQHRLAIRRPNLH